MKFPVESKIQSAGTLSPVSRSITSPITSSPAFITFTFPSLITFEVGDAISFNASKDFSVLNSCTKPSIEFIITIMSIVIASAFSPINPDIIVATISIQVIKSLN